MKRHILFFLLWTLPTMSVADVEIYDELIEITYSGRIEQNMKEVPSATILMDTGLYKKAGVRNFTDLSRHIPGMVVMDGGDAYATHSTIGYHGFKDRTSKTTQFILDGQQQCTHSSDRQDCKHLFDYSLIGSVEANLSPFSTYFSQADTFTTIIMNSKVPVADESILYVYGDNAGGNTASYTQHFVNDGEYFTLNLRHNNPYGFTDNSFNDPGVKDDERYDLIDLKYRADSLEVAATLSQSNINQSCFNHELFSPFDCHADEKTHSLMLKKSFSIMDDHQNDVRVSYLHKNQDHIWYYSGPVYEHLPIASEMWALDPRLTDDIIAQGVTDVSNASLEFQALAQQYFSESALIGFDFFDLSTSFDIKDEAIKAEFSDYYNNDNVHIVSAVGLEQDRITSNAHLQGTIQERTAYAFNNTQLDLDDRWILNTGLQVGKKINSEADKTYSLRLGLNYKLSDDSVIRLAGLVSSQNVIAFNRRMNLIYYVEQLDDDPRIQQIFGEERTSSVYFISQPWRKLKNESYQNVELTFYQAFNKGFCDVKAFVENREDLLQDFELTGFHQFDPNNGGHTDIKGVEFKCVATYGDLTIGGNYSNMRWEANIRDGLNFMADETGAAFAVYDVNDTNSVGVTHYANSAILDESYDRTDLTYTAKYREVEAQLIYTRLWSDDYPAFIGTQFSYERSNILTAGIKFSF